MDDTAFTVSATGRALPTGLWQIEAQLRFLDGVRPRPGDLILGSARFALLQAVFGQINRGKLRGATRFHVCVDELGRIQEWGFPEAHAEAEPAR